MAMYKAKFTVYKDPAGKTMKGPTALHFLGDLCSGFGLIGILEAILSVMEGWGAKGITVGVVLAVAGFALCVVLHRRAKRGAEQKFVDVLAQMEGQDTAKKP